MGADYNLLLISRIREEAAHGVRSGVIRTVGSTGAVITSAGLIFAASMFGLTFASITTLVQIGFIIGAGILLDTFLVRTITVPAVAALVGRANWWPSRPTLPNEQAEAVPMLQRLTKANWLPPRLRPRTSRIKQAEQPPAPPSPTKPNQRRPLRSHKPPIELSSTSQDEKTPRSHHLTSDTSSRGTPIRVAVPPTITEHHRQRRHKATNISRATLYRCSVRTPCQSASPRTGWNLWSMTRSPPTVSIQLKRTANTQPTTNGQINPSHSKPTPSSRLKPMANHLSTPTAKNPSKNVGCLHANAGNAWAHLPWNVHHE